jgi:hypothetical protein
MITGTTKNSRLNELRKYKITNVFDEKYVGNGSYSSDGVDFNHSISGVTVVYYIGGIKFVDNVSASTTNFYYTPINSSSFTELPYYKNPDKNYIVSNPKINDDVFIVRQELSAFDSNYKLEFIRNLVDLTSYAGGNFFNIVNNT